MLKLDKTLSFDWYKGNLLKNLIKHNVNNKECEEAFGDKSKKILEDIKHSYKESRFLLLGKTKSDRLLYIVFTLRGRKVRVVSARDLNKKEYKYYEKRT
jgi:uncharacterized protein